MSGSVVVGTNRPAIPRKALYVAVVVLVAAAAFLYFALPRFGPLPWLGALALAVVVGSSAVWWSLPYSQKMTVAEETKQYPVAVEHAYARVLAAVHDGPLSGSLKVHELDANSRWIEAFTRISLGAFGAAVRFEFSSVSDHETSVVVRTSPISQNPSRGEEPRALLARISSELDDLLLLK